jgi:Dynamin family
MQSAIAHNLDALAAWRAAVDRQLSRLSRALGENELQDESTQAQLTALRERLSSDKLVLAFVAEFSRGKSELINAIFFADAGRRVLPATPGRTTMCPVELRYDMALPARLSLLPIETRLRGLSLSDLRPREEAWHHVELGQGNADALAVALSAVTRTQRVTVEQAKALGFWHESQPEDNPPMAADGTVEVPAWRHALINYPHPLLERGLVVIDTPGLNAIGAEPELTLGLLPTAHAVVFVLGADTGVTRSDMAVWRDHLGGASLERFVVLNKIDTLVDPLATTAEVEQQIEQQRAGAAEMLEMPLARVFAVSAREALTARVGPHFNSPSQLQALVAANPEGTANAGRLPALERALALELMPRRQELLVQSASAVVKNLRHAAARQLADRRRQITEQLADLHGLRGKSGAKLKLMLERVDIEANDFERCTARLAALRAMQLRSMRELTTQLSSDTLRTQVKQMQTEAGSRAFSLAGRGPFEALMARLKDLLTQGQSQANEMRQMLSATFSELNADFGFAFTIGPAPVLDPFVAEVTTIADAYSRYFGVTQAWRMATPGFADQFRRMLLQKLRVVFENALGEVELWSKSATTQIEQQSRERRRGFTRRRDALQRVQVASGDLEQRISEVQAQDDQLVQALARVDKVAEEADNTIHRKPDDVPTPQAAEGVMPLDARPANDSNSMTAGFAIPSSAPAPAAASAGAATTTEPAQGLIERASALAATSQAPT